jgi:rfaE bifunctional protein nucleotidyltransferase chain/domain
MNKLITVENLSKLYLKGTLVTTNGCFDILHIGHIRLLKFAKSYGGILVVGVNTDESIRKLKGPTRPVFKQDERIEILSAIEYIDYIIMFSDDTPCGLIERIRPDVHVKGGDYNPDDFDRMPEAKIVKRYGGQIKIFPLVSSISTTSIIERIKS